MILHDAADGSRNAHFVDDCQSTHAPASTTTRLSGPEGRADRAEDFIKRDLFGVDFIEGGRVYIGDPKHQRHYDSARKEKLHAALGLMDRMIKLIQGERAGLRGSCIRRARDSSSAQRQAQNTETKQ